ncbi:MAG: LacI family DNA-binding transcriptional regulator [Rhodococcus fascians]|nr:LacI family DNA-binding transcriptional regulator [Rhodococcus sp. 06-418-1B]OZC75576.1 LacI family transcriptional regulator [Rhodococcus sp. 06-418-1B]
MHPRPTMADVAAAAGVSTMSVSYTYNQPTRVSDATRTRVLAAAERLGYTGPHTGARSLRSGKTNNVGVVLSEKLTYSFENPQARAFLTGIAEACLDTDSGLVLLPNGGRSQPNSPAKADLERIRGAQVDGYVLWTTVSDDPMLDVVIGTGKPVCIQGGPVVPGAAMIGIDDSAAALAVGQVGLRQSTKPAVISFPRNRDRVVEIVHGPDPADATFPVTAARLAGFRRAVVDAGFKWESTPVAFAGTNASPDGADAAHRLVDADALLCCSDDLALGALDVVGPLDGCDGVAITGWDDSDAARAAGLTTVAQSLFDQGCDAARWVLGSLDRIPESPWSVQVRNSTRPARPH